MLRSTFVRGSVFSVEAGGLVRALAVRAGAHGEGLGIDNSDSAPEPVLLDGMDSSGRAACPVA